jgi:hypothetical protein
MSVRGDQGHTFNNSLRYKQTVEGVAVDGWKSEQPRKVFSFDGQQV